jgi:hypothetical protein
VPDPRPFRQEQSYSTDLRPAKLGSRAILRGSNSVDRSVETGQLRRCGRSGRMSAMPPITTKPAPHLDGQKGAKTELRPPQQMQPIRTCRRPAHSTNSSASDSNGAGIANPNALAVVILMTNWNLVGCSTGISPAFAPRRILSTKSAARRNKSVKSGP